jgi:hypothetical protein
MSAAPHKAHDFQGVPIRQDGLSVEPLWDDLPVALYRNPPGVKARIGQIVGQGAPGHFQPFSVDLYQLVSSFRNKKAARKNYTRGGVPLRAAFACTLFLIIAKTEKMSTLIRMPSHFVS